MLLQCVLVNCTRSYFSFLTKKDNICIMLRCFPPRFQRINVFSCVRFRLNIASCCYSVEAAVCTVKAIKRYKDLLIFLPVKEKEATFKLPWKLEHSSDFLHGVFLASKI